MGCVVMDPVKTDRSAFPGVVADPLHPEEVLPVEFGFAPELPQIELQIERHHRTQPEFLECEPARAAHRPVTEQWAS